MSEQGFTPGPWKVRHQPGSDDVGDCFVEAQRPEESSIPYGIEILGDDFGEHCEYPSDQRRADAELIAAAPELLEACEFAKQALEAAKSQYRTPGVQFAFDDELEQITAAIRKAKGDA